MKPALLATLLTCTVTVGAASAEPEPANEVLPPVRTELKRDSNVLPYAQINSVLSKMQRYGENVFRMDFKVDPAKTKRPLAEIRMAVRSDDADYPLSIEPDGAFTLPVLPDAEAQTADLATNVAKGQMAIRGLIELNTTPEELTLAKVRQAMRVAHKLREEILPFYLRWLFPRVQGVRICSATPTWELEWRENGQLMGLTLPQAVGERDPRAKKGEPGRPCTVLNGQENWPEAARLVPPPNTQLSIKL
jgi:hypothetical protein